MLGLFPFKFFSDNKDAPDPKTVEKYMQNKDPNETGKDRIRRMFSKKYVSILCCFYSIVTNNYCTSSILIVYLKISKV